MQTESVPKTESMERTGYFPVPGAHLYTVLHSTKDPVARILLVGAFAPERQFAYHTWVRWGRYLAARRIEVLRYDYRGVGESTGDFAEMSFKDWSEDVRLLSAWLDERSPRLPLVLHGLEMGAILAARHFDEGVGDALLLWSPPATANQVLRSTLQRWSGLEQLYESPENRKSASQYVRQLEQSSSIEVQGYSWPPHLWHESSDFGLPRAIAEEKPHQKPIKLMKFGKNSASVAMPYVRFAETEDLSALYAQTYDWIARELSHCSKRAQ